MSKIDTIIDEIVRREGSTYTNDPSDRGGPTKYGITLDTLAGYRNARVTAADVEALSEDEARAIYYCRYVVESGFAAVLKHSEAIAEELIDSGVNCGTGRASKWLQQSLNVLNRGERDYADLVVDGEVGQATIHALRGYLRNRGTQGERVLLRALNSLQGAHYIMLSERDARQERFTYGWFANRVGMT